MQWLPRYSCGEAIVSFGYPTEGQTGQGLLSLDECEAHIASNTPDCWMQACCSLLASYRSKHFRVWYRQTPQAPETGQVPAARQFEPHSSVSPVYANSPIPSPAIGLALSAPSRRPGNASVTSLESRPAPASPKHQTGDAAKSAPCPIPPYLSTFNR